MPRFNSPRDENEPNDPDPNATATATAAPETANATPAASETSNSNPVPSGTSNTSNAIENPNTLRQNAETRRNNAAPERPNSLVLENTAPERLSPARTDQTSPNRRQNATARSPNAKSPRGSLSPRRNAEASGENPDRSVSTQSPVKSPPFDVKRVVRCNLEVLPPPLDNRVDLAQFHADTSPKSETKSPRSRKSKSGAKGSRPDLSPSPSKSVSTLSPNDESPSKAHAKEPQPDPSPSKSGAGRSREDRSPSKPNAEGPNSSSSSSGGARPRQNLFPLRSDASRSRPVAVRSRPLAARHRSGAARQEASPARSDTETKPTYPLPTPVVQTSPYRYSDLYPCSNSYPPLLYYRINFRNTRLDAPQLVPIPPEQRRRAFSSSFPESLRSRSPGAPQADSSAVRLRPSAPLPTPIVGPYFPTLGALFPSVAPPRQLSPLPAIAVESPPLEETAPNAERARAAAADISRLSVDGDLGNFSLPVIGGSRPRNNRPLQRMGGAGYTATPPGNPVGPGPLLGAPAPTYGGPARGIGLPGPGPGSSGSRTGPSGLLSVDAASETDSGLSLSRDIVSNPDLSAAAAEADDPGQSSDGTGRRQSGSSSGVRAPPPTPR